VRAGEAGLFLGERGFDLFSGENERDEHGLAASAVFMIRRRGRKASEAVAAVDELFNGQEQELILRHGKGRSALVGENLRLGSDERIIELRSDWTARAPVPK